MSPQEAIKILNRKLQANWFAPPDEDEAAISVAIAALEREAKAEPVAWEIIYPSGGKTITTDAEWIKYLEAYPDHLVQPLYASPPGPETQ